MGKKKTPVFRNGADNETNSTKDDKINAIRTWDDIEHDSEDDCRLIVWHDFSLVYWFFGLVHDDRGKVLLKEGQESDEG